MKGSLRYGTAALLVVLVASLSYLLVSSNQYGSQSYLPYVLVVIVCSATWGLGPGISATLLGAAAGHALSSSTGIHSQFDLMVFLLAGTAISIGGSIFRRARERSSETEERFLMAQRCAAVGTWDWMVGSDERYWSTGYRDVFGVPADMPATRENFRRSVHPDDWPNVVEAAERALVSGDYRVEYRINSGSGERWILGVGRPIYDNTGRAVRMSGIVMDITALKKTGSALRETRDRYEALMECAPLAILLGDQQGEITYCNQNWITMTGLSAAESAGGGWAKALYPGDAQVLSLWRDSVAASTPFEIEARIQSSESEPFRWHLIKGVPLSSDGLGPSQWMLVFADIHERKSYEELVKRLGDNLPDGAIYQIVSRPDGTSSFTYVSAGIQRVFGVSPEQVIKDFNVMYDLIYEPDLPALRDAEDSARRERRTYEHEFRQRTLSGDIKWVLCRAAPQFFDDGSVAWNGIVIDITARKHAEEALKRSEERFRLAAKAVIGTVYDWDVERNFIYRSEGIERLIGLSPSFVEATPEWGMKRVHPDDQQRVRDTFRALFGAGEGHYALEYKVRHENGSWIDVWDQGYVVRDREGGVVRVVGCMSDMTEQKRIQAVLQGSEEKFRTLADTLPQLVWSSLANGASDYFNERWYEYTGIARGQTPEPFAPLWVHPDDLAGAIAGWAESCASGASYQRELRLQSGRDGSYRWFIARALPIRDDRGRIVRWFGTFTDVHDHRVLLEEREALLESERAARTEAEKASNSKDQFVAVLSHELRSPLHAILGWAQMMKRGKLDADGMAQAIDVIEKNTRLQAQLISDLLDINRIVSGKIKLDLRDIELDGVVDAAVKSIMPAAEVKKISIVRENRISDAYITADTARIQQIAWNLLSNAVKFSPKNGTITVVTERIERWVRLSVIDSGEGIDPAFIPKIFQRYTQADPASIRKHGGLGLGLSIVKHLVDLHGGHVSVESKGKDRGATFSVMLCMTPDDRLASSEERIEREEIRLEGVRVLVVDDEPDSRELVQRILADSEATVTAVPGADQALEKVFEFNPDVIVSDIGMPGKDGYTFVKELRDREGTRKYTPAIALTAFARAEDRSRALRAGFQTHLAKPVDAVELVAAVGNLAKRQGRPSVAGR